jgi:hypothetical protein
MALGSVGTAISRIVGKAKVQKGNRIPHLEHCSAHKETAILKQLSLPKRV